MEGLTRVVIIQGLVRRLITCLLPRRNIPVKQYVKEAFDISQYNPCDFEITHVELMGYAVDPKQCYELPEDLAYVIIVYVKKPRNKKG